MPQESLHPLVMIECPRLLFPFARNIIATSARDAGFPPLLLDPIDFVGLYRQNLARQQAAAASLRRHAKLSSCSGLTLISKAGLALLRDHASAWGRKIPARSAFAERRDEGAVSLAIGLGEPRRERHCALPPRHIA